MRHQTAIKERETKFIRVLQGWRLFFIDDHFADGIPVHYEFIISPTQQVYRYASAWEKPTLIIDADILSPRDHIRLVRIAKKNGAMRVLKAMRAQDKRLKKVRKH